MYDIIFVKKIMPYQYIGMSNSSDKIVFKATNNGGFHNASQNGSFIGIDLHNTDKSSFLTEDIFKHLEDVDRYVYEIGHNESNDNSYWEKSQLKQTFTMLVSSLTPLTARWRVGRTENGNVNSYLWEQWKDITQGEQFVTLNECSWDCKIVLQIDGNFEMTTFNHRYGNMTDSIYVNFERNKLLDFQFSSNVEFPIQSTYDSIKKNIQLYNAGDYGIAELNMNTNEDFQFEVVFDADKTLNGIYNLLLYDWSKGSERQISIQPHNQGHKVKIDNTLVFTAESGSNTISIRYKPQSKQIFVSDDNFDTTNDISVNNDSLTCNFISRLQIYQNNGYCADSVKLYSYASLTGGTIYFDANATSDNNADGTEDKPYKTLDMLTNVILNNGASVCLSRGSTFDKPLDLKYLSNVIVIDYGYGSERPLIDLSHYSLRATYLACIDIRNSTNMFVENIHLKAAKDVNDYTVTSLQALNAETKARLNNNGSISAGILITSNESFVTSNITISNLEIEKIYAMTPTVDEGKYNFTSHGIGILIANVQHNLGNLGANISSGRISEYNDWNINSITIKDCHFHDISYRGIYACSTNNLEIENNVMEYIGGPSIMVAISRNFTVRKNNITYSGHQERDSITKNHLYHERASGMWTWRVVGGMVEENTFAYSKGRRDSYGIHLDFDSHNVIIQRNLSIQNSGGFIQILGLCENSIWRYNISINDETRTEDSNLAENSNGRKVFYEPPENWIGEANYADGGALIRVSGYTGSNNELKGPFNSYIHNNSIYNDATFSTVYHKTLNGLYIANNALYYEGNEDLSNVVRIVSPNDGWQSSTFTTDDNVYSYNNISNKNIFEFAGSTNENNVIQSTVFDDEISNTQTNESKLPYMKINSSDEQGKYPIVPITYTSGENYTSQEFVTAMEQTTLRYFNDYDNNHIRNGILPIGARINTTLMADSMTLGTEEDTPKTITLSAAFT